MVDIAAYLRRLRLADPALPSVPGLVALHRAHVERIAYNTLDIHLRRVAGTDPEECARRVATLGRSGYCINLNAAFSALLRGLGYDVRWHRGWVWRDSEDDVASPECLNHLALTVHGLPDPANPDGSWLVDAGLGDALHEPVPLRIGPATQGPFHYRVQRSGRIAGGWSLRHDPAGAFIGMDFGLDPAGPTDFVAAHQRMSTAPDSPFVQFVSVQRREESGVDKLVSATLTRIDRHGRRDREITTAAEWFSVLADVFGLTLHDVAPEQRRALWRRVRLAQEQWQAGAGVGHRRMVAP